MTTWRCLSAARRAAAFAASAAATVGIVLGAAHAAEDMQKIIEGAKKEGELIIHIGPGKQFRDARLTGFNEKYPFIKVHAINTANRESMPKLLRERKAGIYALDVHHGGPPNLLRVYIPNGFLAPLRDAIVDPAIMDDKIWRDGFADGFQDKDAKFVYAYDRTPGTAMHINWDKVSKKDFTKIEDLLKPELEGKFVWHDPRSPGPGFAVAVLFYMNFGEDFLTKLLQKQAVYTNNRRQVAEWVVRGRYPIGLGAANDFVQIFEKQGLAKNVAQPPHSWFKLASASSGNANIVYMDKAPHPNAAKLYINWFLQREQQQQWANITERVSRRLDTKPGAPGLEHVPGQQYADIFHHKYSATIGKVLALARDTIKAERDKDDN